MIIMNPATRRRRSPKVGDVSRYHYSRLSSALCTRVSFTGRSIPTVGAGIVSAAGNRSVRHVTDLAWYAGTGNQFDPAKSVLPKARSFMLHPAKATHWDGSAGIAPRGNDCYATDPPEPSTITSEQLFRGMNFDET